MRGLLDVNLLIALLDPDHVFHDRAHAWWSAHGGEGWASCPLTENGVVRVMSNPRYSATLRLHPSELIDRLSRFAGGSSHEFWPDSLSLRDPHWFAFDRMRSSQVADIYLLALAVSRGGRLVTFDTSIPRSAVPSARAEHLVVV